MRIEIHGRFTHGDPGNGCEIKPKIGLTPPYPFRYS
jgi:hypothetical protein